MVGFCGVCLERWCGFICEYLMAELFMLFPLLSPITWFVFCVYLGGLCFINRQSLFYPFVHKYFNSSIILGIFFDCGWLQINESASVLFINGSSFKNAEFRKKCHPVNLVTLFIFQKSYSQMVSASQYLTECLTSIWGCVFMVKIPFRPYLEGTENLVGKLNERTQISEIKIC